MQELLVSRLVVVVAVVVDDDEIEEPRAEEEGAQLWSSNALAASQETQAEAQS